MKRTRLSQPAELTLFRQHFEKRSGNVVSLAYLQSSHVYGFWRGDEMLAGYVIHAGEQHRFFALLGEIGWEHIRKMPGQQRDYCEITCMWIEPEARSFVFRFQFYVTCMAVAFARRKAYLIGGTKVKAVSRAQNDCLPNILFQGETHNSIGSGHWTIYYGTMLSCLGGFGRQFVREVMKQLGLTARVQHY